MARKPSALLTDAELRLMRVIWRQGASTVQDVVNAFPPNALPAYSTVLTTLRILERKGYLVHRKKGRAFLYEPVVDKDTVRQGALRHLMQRFFDDSPELLAMKLMENTELDLNDLARLKALIDATPDEDAP